MQLTAEALASWLLLSSSQNRLLSFHCEHIQGTLGEHMSGVVEILEPLPDLGFEHHTDGHYQAGGKEYDRHYYGRGPDRD